MSTSLLRFDTRLTRQIQALPRSFRPFFAKMTLVGQPVFALLAAAAVSYYGEYAGDWRLIVAGLIVAITSLFASALKFVLRRKRPLTEYAAAMYFKTYSFPSGHAAATSACYGLIAYLSIMSGNLLITATGIVLVPLIVAIGISRIYLGAHFPSDVIGGWIFGGIGLALAIWILQQ